MVGQSIWKNLKILVDIDNEIQETQEKISNENKFIDKNRSNIENLESEHLQLKQRCKEIRKKLDTEELKTKSLKEQEASKEKTLDNVKNKKQYDAIEKEIQNISQKIMFQEDVLIKSWHEYDSIKKRAEETKKSNKDKIESLSKKIDEQIEIVENFKTKEATKQNEKNKAAEKIPSEWLVKYNKMRAKISNPIVPVINSSCSECYYSIIRQDMQKLRNNNVIPCRNCYRLLYYEPEKETENEGSF